MPGIMVHETKELDILVLDGMGPDTMESGHFFLGLGFLSFQEGTLRTNMPT